LTPVGVGVGAVAVTAGIALSLSGVADIMAGINGIVQNAKGKSDGGDKGKTKETKVNPDGTDKNPIDQYDQVKEYQDQIRKPGYDISTEKSQQNLDKWLKDIDIEDIDWLNEEGF
ncbi:MAG: hypothetical protein JXB88_24975, partial [Spirochaetales bacterium]|nr:hypothetical protein [Spirochaetales bacterium]